MFLYWIKKREIIAMICFECFGTFMFTASLIYSAKHGLWKKVLKLSYCVFLSAFGCGAHLKAGKNILYDHFQPFCLI